MGRGSHPVVTDGALSSPDLATEQGAENHVRHGGCCQWMRSRRDHIVRLAGAGGFLLFVMAAGVVTVALAKPVLVPFLEGLQTHKQPARAAIFMATFAPMIPLLFPFFCVDLAAGYVCGVTVGVPVSLFTKTLGALACYLLARYACRKLMQRWLYSRYEWLRALEVMVLDRPYQTLFLARFSAGPAGAKNYMFCTLPCTARQFSVATMAASIPMTALLVPLGAHLQHPSDIFSKRATSTPEKVMAAVALALLLVLVWWLRREVNRRLAAAKLMLSPRETTPIAGSLTPLGAGSNKTFQNNQYRAFQETPGFVRSGSVELSSSGLLENSSDIPAVLPSPVHYVRRSQQHQAEARAASAQGVVGFQHML